MAKLVQRGDADAYWYVGETLYCTKCHAKYEIEEEDVTPESEVSWNVTVACPVCGEFNTLGRYEAISRDYRSRGYGRTWVQK